MICKKRLWRKSYWCMPRSLTYITPGIKIAKSLLLFQSKKYKWNCLSLLEEPQPVPSDILGQDLPRFGNHLSLFGAHETHGGLKASIEGCRLGRSVLYSLALGAERPRMWLARGDFCFETDRAHKNRTSDWCYGIDPCRDARKSHGKNRSSTLLVTVEKRGNIYSTTILVSLFRCNECQNWSL